MSDKPFINLQSVREEVNKELKGGILVTEDDVVIKKWISTGFTLLDLFFYGGIPVGRIWEIYSPEESQGKTTLTLHLLIAIQKAGGISQYLEAEGSPWDIKRAQRMGHNPHRHIPTLADTCEIGFDAIESTVIKIRGKEELYRKEKKKNIPTAPLGIAWDTIAASPIEAERAGSKYKDGMSYKPRLIREKLRSMSLFLPRNEVSLIFVNQAIATIGDMFGPGYTTPGGGAIKFWAVHRVVIWKAGKFQPEGRDEGILAKLKLTKCKVGPPFRTVSVALNYNNGIDEDYTNFNFLTRSDATDTARKYVERRGSWYYIKGYNTWKAQLEDPEAKTVKNDEFGLYASQLRKKIKQFPDVETYLKEGVISEWHAAYPGSPFQGNIVSEGYDE